MSSTMQAGQASVEFLVTAVGILIALAVVAVAGQQRCIKGWGGQYTSTACRDMTQSVVEALQSTIEDVTFLINLPF